MKKLLLAGALALALVLPAQAKESYLLVGAGAGSCAQMAREYAASPTKATRASLMDVYLTWAQGYMSGMNLFAKDNEKRALNGEPNAEQELFLREYCDAHPLAVVDQGVLQLYLALPKAAALSKDQ